MQSPVKIWRNQKKVGMMVGKTGRVVSWTTIRVPPGDFVDQAPYLVVLVALDGGQKITAQLVDFEHMSVAIGQQVITVIRRIILPTADGVIQYGIKVKPI